MLKNLYTIYDTEAGESGPVFEAKNDKVALRFYKQMLDREKVVGENFLKLYKIGVFENEKPEILDATPEEVNNGE